MSQRLAVVLFASCVLPGANASRRSIGVIFAWGVATPSQPDPPISGGVVATYQMQPGRTPPYVRSSSYRSLTSVEQAQRVAATWAQSDRRPISAAEARAARASFARWAARQWTGANRPIITWL